MQLTSTFAPASLLEDVKSALNMTTTTHDAELTRLLEQAAAEYGEKVRLLPGTHSIRVSSPNLVPRGTVSVESVTPDAGTLDPSTGLYFDAVAGILSTRPIYGGGSYTITLTAGPIPANHLGVIVADVAEYWTRTQRAGGGSRPSFGGDGFDPVEAGRPLVQFPRINALAGQTVG